jgi:hypothetical protein
MRVEAGEIELTGDEKEDSEHRFQASVSVCLALGGLKRTVDGFDEAVGLAGLRPGDDAGESIHVLHRLDLGGHDVGAPLLQRL